MPGVVKHRMAGFYARLDGQTEDGHVLLSSDQVGCYAIGGEVDIAVSWGYHAPFFLDTQMTRECGLASDARG